MWAHAHEEEDPAALIRTRSLLSVLARHADRKAMLGLRGGSEVLIMPAVGDINISMSPIAIDDSAAVQAAIKGDGQRPRARIGVRGMRPGVEGFSCSSCGELGVSWGVGTREGGADDVGQPWERLVCRLCAKKEKEGGPNGLISLNRKCLVCTRSATFGRLGGKRRDALHCKVWMSTLGDPGFPSPSRLQHLC